MFLRLWCRQGQSALVQRAPACLSYASHRIFSSTNEETAIRGGSSRGYMQECRRLSNALLWFIGEWLVGMIFECD